MIQPLIHIVSILGMNKGKLPVVYIAGKVTGLPYSEVYAKFKIKEVELSNQGFFVLNPCELMPSDTNWFKAMRIAIVAVVCSKHICLLPDWHLSKGAILERSLALALGISTLEG